MLLFQDVQDTRYTRYFIVMNFTIFVTIGDQVFAMLHTHNGHYQFQ